MASTMARYFAQIKSAILPGKLSGPQGATVEMGQGDFGKSSDKRKISLYSEFESLPKFDCYAKDTLTGRTKNRRPSLDLLRKPPDPSDLLPPPEEEERARVKLVRLGWLLGVMIRNMCNIWGVLMFLRLPWITSQAGLILTFVIIFMSVTVTTITATSVSAISTNGKIYSGGTYFLISRTLGPELGAPIGLIFAFANALSSALSTVGFADTVSSLMEANNAQMVDPVNDPRIIGSITVFILLLIILAGMGCESKAQLFFFFAILISLTNYFVGTFLTPTPAKMAGGFFSYRSDIFVQNLLPSFRGPSGNFFLQFSIFFPLATGILTGVNICGDLKDPNGGIPIGTLLAILWTTLTYVIIAITISATVVRDASGNLNDTINPNSSAHCTGVTCQYGWNFDSCANNFTCTGGAENNFQIMSLVSGFGYLITMGIFACTLSSALGHLVSAPKVFQRLCQDNIYPYIGFFAKGYGKNKDPVRSYVLMFLIALLFVNVGNLNTIAPILSNFYLCSYGLINFSCFHASFTEAPGWRPEFRYYNKWVSLFGAFLAFLLMFLFNWWAALLTVLLIFFLMGYVSYKKPQVNWGSSYQASIYNMALSFSVALSGVDDHVKNYRPQCLVLTGPPNSRPALVDFVATFTKNICLMICGHIIMEEQSSVLPGHSTDLLLDWLNQRKVRAFYSSLCAGSLKDGAHSLMQASGLGKLKPNTLILGFKKNWQECRPESLQDYVNTISDAFDSYYGVCVLKMMDGLDVTENVFSAAGQSSAVINPVYEEDEETQTEADNSDRNSDTSEDLQTDQVNTVFQMKQGRKTIDIYWMTDDGGLTLLVPYLLTRRNRWKKSKIRIFLLGFQETLEEDRKDMMMLLKRFRLQYKEIVVITDVDRAPTPKSVQRFEDSIAPFRLSEEQKAGDVQELKRLSPWIVSDKDMEAMRPKVERTLRLNEIVKRNSVNAALVVISLPVPDVNCPSSLYMSWLDALSHDVHCPVLLVRGNQENVMTFYCQ